MLRLISALAAGIGIALFFSRKSAALMPSDESAENHVEYVPQESDIPAEVENIASEVIDTVKNATAGAVATVFGTKYDSLIHASAAQAGIDPGVLYRLLYAESHFREDIITGRKKSSVGALGIAQFMPATAQQWLGSVDAALDPNRAIPGAARYLKYLANYFGGDMVKAVAAYNWGMGNVQKKGLAKAPMETQQYVFNITGESIA